MRRKCSLSKASLIGTLIFATTMAMTMSTDGWAMLAPAQTIGDVQEMSPSRAADLKTIQTSLESKLIRQRLAEFKLTPEEIDARLSRMSDAQVHQTASLIRTANPGGDAGSLLISVLVIAVLVALFLYVFKRI
jgi:hypothetical protein